MPLCPVTFFSRSLGGGGGRTQEISGGGRKSMVAGPGGNEKHLQHCVIVFNRKLTKKAHV